MARLASRRRIWRSGCYPGSRAERGTETAIHAILLGATVISVATTLAIIFILLTESFRFFTEVSPWEFLTGTKWTPRFVPAFFGVLPLVAGTVLVAAIAILVAGPVGIFTAIFLSEYAPDRVRRIIKPMLEILAGIPTVVYGYFALTFVTPLLQEYLFPDMIIFNALERRPCDGSDDHPDCVLANGGRDAGGASLTA